MMRKILGLSLMLLLGACAMQQTSKNVHIDLSSPTDFLETYEHKAMPLYEEDALAWWQASTTGSDKAFERKQAAEKALNGVHSNKEQYAKIVAWLADSSIQDPLIKRQLEIAKHLYLPKQVDSETLSTMITLATQVEKSFNTHRSVVNGKELSENEIRKILSTSHNSDEVKSAWEAYHEVAKKVDGQLKELVTLRNKTAQQLGYNNYYEMALAVGETTPEELLALFDELDNLTKQPFAEVKAEVDTYLAKHFSIKTDQLRPWHYQDLFFQEAPSIYNYNLDQLFKGKSLEKMIGGYYTSIGLDASDILKRGDLYEKEGKTPHAFCVDMNRKGDVRVITNLVSDARWADTLLHELGHGVYYKYIDRKLPYLLRDVAHTLTTEGIAMLFGRMAKNGEWLKKVAEVDEQTAKQASEVAKKTMRLESLVFSRWAQVMVRFEHGIYSNPDQDWSKLWWDLKKKYQLLQPPENRNAPDYAAKIHIILYPVYYQNYMLGSLFASQVHRYIAKTIYNNADPNDVSYAGNKSVGAYFIEKIFKPGAKMKWQDLMKYATGEELTPRYFAQDFISVH